MSTLIDSEIAARCVKGNPKRANSTGLSIPGGSEVAR